MIDRLGHFEVGSITVDGATVPDAKLVTIERLSTSEIAIAIWRPGRDAVIFTLRSPSPIAMSHCYDVMADADLKTTRFEVLPRDEGGYYVVDHWRDDPYPAFETLEEAERFVFSRT